MLTSETKNRIQACRDVLVGKLPLPTDQVELITAYRSQNPARSRPHLGDGR